MYRVMKNTSHYHTFYLFHLCKVGSIERHADYQMYVSNCRNHGCLLFNQPYLYLMGSNHSHYVPLINSVFTDRRTQEFQIRDKDNLLLVAQEDQKQLSLGSFPEFKSNWGKAARNRCYQHTLWTTFSFFLSSICLFVYCSLEALHPVPKYIHGDLF